MKNAVRQLIETRAGALSLGFPTHWHNTTPPQAGAPVWGRWSIVWGKTEPATIGATMNRTVGILFLQVFAREDEGSKAAHDAADAMAAASAFRQWHTNFIAAGTGNLDFTEVTGPSTAPGAESYSVWNISASFRVDFLPAA